MHHLPRLVLALALAAAPGLAAAARADGDSPPAGPAPAAPGAAQGAAPGAEGTAEAKPAAAAWMTDFDAAAAKARAEGKDLLVDFTGSDWCGWCKRLDAEVFTQPQFAAGTAKDFVLVSLDFPNGEEAKARVPNPARNQELVGKHEVEGFPTILLMSPEGDVYARLGYEEGGADAWLASMTKARAAGRPAMVEAIALAAEWAKAKGDARPPLVEKAVALVEKAGPGAAWVTKVLPAAREALALDADGSKGLQARAVKAMLANGTADDSVRAAARKLDPKNEKGLLELAVMSEVAAVRDEESVRAALKAIEDLEAAGPLRDVEVKRALWANAAFWNMQVLSDPPKAKAFARKLKTVADPANPRLRQLVDAILGADDAPPDEKK